MTFPSLKSAALTFLAAVGGLTQSALAEDDPLRVMFVNQFPDTTIDLYWENHAHPDDHPDRRRLEARIAPRGGWHASETFNGHGEFKCFVMFYDVLRVLYTHTHITTYYLIL